MIVAITILLFLIVLNGIFAMSELAIMTSRHSRLEGMALRGQRGAAMAMSLAKEPTRFLSTVQVAITLIGILAGAFGEAWLSDGIERLISRVEWLAPHSPAIAMTLVVIAITFFSLVIGELVPKRIALAFPERSASVIAPPLVLLSRLAAYPVRVLSAATEAVLAVLRVPQPNREDLSEEDVKVLVAKAASSGIFSPEEHRIVDRVMRLGDIEVGSLVVPRNDIIWLDESMSAEDVKVLVGTSPYSHFPVCRGSLDEILGVVHIKDLIAHGLIAGNDFKVLTVAQPPLFIPETTAVLKVLETFQRSRTHIAFVIDEYGGTEGLVTVNDIVQAILGDISRQGEDGPPMAVRRSDGSWLLDGRLPMHELLATLGLSVSQEELPDVHTAAGLVMALLDRLPTLGESIEWQGWRLEVVDMDGQRIDQILAAKLASPEPSDGVVI
jgi:putative hemolysin